MSLKSVLGSKVCVGLCIPSLETLKFLLLIESEDAGFLEGSLQFAEAAELLLAAAGC